jgi:hypothetical protein
MRRVFLVLALTLVALGMVAMPTLAGGDQNQNEKGTATAPGPGDDAQGKQASG